MRGRQFQLWARTGDHALRLRDARLRPAQRDDHVVAVDVDLAAAVLVDLSDGRALAADDPRDDVIAARRDTTSFNHKCAVGAVSARLARSRLVVVCRRPGCMCDIRPDGCRHTQPKRARPSSRVECCRLLLDGRRASSSFVRHAPRDLHLDVLAVVHLQLLLQRHLDFGDGLRDAAE